MRILIVDDESLIRLPLAEEFEQAGFEVLQAESGDAATALIEEPPIPLSLLITDLTMPGTLDGIQLGRLMRARHPGVPIIYISGQPDACPAVNELRACDRFVAKPFSFFGILSLARRLIAQTSPHAG